MIATIHAEWIKLRSVRSNFIVFTIAVVLAVGIAIIVALVADPSLSDDNDVTLATAGVQIANLLFGILGVQIIGQEYRFGTIRPTYTAVPNRRRVLLAKLVTIVAATLAFSVVMMALAVGVVLAFGPGDIPLDGPAWGAIIGGVAFSLGFAAFGFAVGAILRQPVAGIIFILAWSFVIESIIVSLNESVGKWMPFYEAGQMGVVDRSDAAIGNDVSHLMSRPAATVYYFAVIGVLVVVGLVLADRRDV